MLRPGELCKSMKSSEKQTDTSGFRLGRSEVLSSLTCYMQTQSQGHYVCNRLQERGAERGSARRSSFNGRERAIVSQTNIGTVSKATFGKFLRDGLERIYGLFREQIDHLELNWTELNWTELKICTKKKQWRNGAQNLLSRISRHKISIRHRQRYDKA